MVGDGWNELLPGLYEYRNEGDNRVEGIGCTLTLNANDDNINEITLPTGELFTIQIYEYHNFVNYGYYSGDRDCNGVIARVGD